MASGRRASSRGPSNRERGTDTAPDRQHEFPQPERGTFAEAWVDLRRDGAAFLPGYVPEELLHPLLVELAAAEFEQQDRDYGNSIQNIESYELRPPFPRHPIVRAIAESLRWFENYDPDHVSVHRYGAGEVGITPHYDLRRYRMLIAALTVRGSAEFSLVEDPDPERKLPSHLVVSARRAAPVLQSWETTAGDLMLMRAPGFAGMEDGRPLHQVSGGKDGGSRTALVFRMDGQSR